jgi:hypothetical protein
MDPFVHHLVTMAHHYAWANHRLLGACAQLDHAEFVAARTSFFLESSIKRCFSKLEGLRASRSLQATVSGEAKGALLPQRGAFLKAPEKIGRPQPSACA